MGERVSRALKIFLEVVLGLAVFLLVFGLLAVAVLYKLGRPEEQAVSVEGIHRRTGIPVEAAFPRRKTFVDRLLTDGRVEALRRSVLRSKLEEVVKEISVRVGERVEQGQVLVEFRKEDLTSAVEAAEAAYEEASKNYERYRSLRGEEVIAQDRLDRALTARENAAAALRRAETALAYAEMSAPIGGYVQERMVEPGELARVGDPLLAIVDLSAVEVRALVPEDEVAMIAEGEEAHFQLEADSEWLKGTVHRVAPSTSDPNRFFDVFLGVQNRRVEGEWRMRPGMYAEVRFVRQRFPDAIAVAERAVAYENGEEAVYLVEETEAEVPVRTPNPGENRETSFRQRLRRGYRKLRRKLNPEEDREAERPVAYERRKVTVVRRQAVRTGLRKEGLVQVKEPPFGLDARVVCNPRDAVEDGVRVKVVECEEPADGDN
ncbi:MAG: efflux RND transporter periplasmic adaptor subunit [Planctomycetota bacterium]